MDFRCYLCLGSRRTIPGCIRYVHGTDSDYAENFMGWYDYKRILTDDIKRQNVLYSGQAFANSNLWVYRNERSRWFPECSNNGVILALKSRIYSSKIGISLSVPPSAFLPMIRCRRHLSWTT